MSITVALTEDQLNRLLAVTFYRLLDTALPICASENRLTDVFMVI